MILVEPATKGIINGVDYTDFRQHPRMVELNIMATFVNFANDYGYTKAEEFFKAIASLIGVDSTKILGIVRNVDRFRQQRVKDKLRYRQEMLFMGAIWGHHRMYTAKFHLHISHTTLYKFGDQLNPDKFVNQEWLDGLNSNVLICGIEAYRNEGARFVDGMFHLIKVFGNVSVSKMWI